MLKQTRAWVLRRLVLFVESQPWLAARVNGYLINRIVTVSRSRPHPWSTAMSYVCWTSLTDQHYSARHLPPKPARNPPPPEKLTGLFARRTGTQRLCPKSTCLFPTFAQYLTDGFIRTRMSHDDEDLQVLRQNTSNHQIDLCPLYGRTPDQTLALRLCSETRKGRLKSQLIGAEEFAPFLYDGDQIAPEFALLDPPLGSDDLTDPAQRAALFAFGGDRANSVPQVAMMNTLLLREHNRLAGEISSRNPDWDDRRVFETARNAVIVLFIKLVVEEYINHIAPTPFRLIADPAVGWHAPWNKPNWITTEFSLLYRWHSLIPDQITWNGQARPVRSTFLDNRPLIEGGLAAGFIAMSGQTAAALGPFNTADALLHIEARSIRQGRVCELAPYADYRAYAGLPRPKRFTDISSNPEVVAFLAEHYARPEEIDFFVGLFAEDTVANSPLPPLILSMVAVDAFSQALTNPLLSEHVFKEETFTPFGWKTIKDTARVRDLVARNVPGPLGEAFIGMTRPDWKFAW